MANDSGVEFDGLKRAFPARPLAARSNRVLRPIFVMGSTRFDSASWSAGTYSTEGLREHCLLTGRSLHM
jgi:hypothetical protein